MWRYFVGTSEPGASWASDTFDDMGWSSVSAPLGFGEPRITSPISMGSAVTLYTRTQFQVQRPADVRGLTLRVSAKAGDTSITVQSASSLAAGDLVMLYAAGRYPDPGDGGVSETLDISTSDAGHFELARIVLQARGGVEQRQWLDIGPSAGLASLDSSSRACCWPVTR